MDLKTLEIDGKSSQKEDACGEVPSLGREPPGSVATRILFLTAFTIDFLRFEVHFSCSVWVLRSDSISGPVWYGSYELLYAMGETKPSQFWSIPHPNKTIFLLVSPSGP